MKEYVWLNKNSKKFLEQDYLEEGQTVDGRVTIIGNTAQKILGKAGFSNKFKEYFKKGWFSLSSPIWTNFGSDRGSGISCFGSYIDDSCDSILSTQAEVSMMSKGGGGTSAYFGKLRQRGALIKDGRNGHSGGPVHFMEIFDKNINIFSQGSTRRGSFSAYLPIEHPDIMEFLQIKTEGHPIQNISFGVTITDDFMNSMIEGDKKKRKVWAKVLESRNNNGFPYLFFKDTINNNTVDVYKDLKMEITHSNICTEIALPDTTTESFVCDLLSLNDLYYYEWKDTDLIELLVYFLDAVMTEFIEKAKKIPFMEKTVLFAERHRALGIGQLGWHSLLQSRDIAFESMEAKLLNTQIAKNIHDAAYAASEKMAVEYGKPYYLQNYNRRHTTLLAIAPTKSSSFILGQASEGIEPFHDNYYIKDLAKGKFTFKNPYLEKLLEEKNENSEDIWNSIMKNMGSVRHLDCLDGREKDIFKTFMEINPMDIIVQAAARQKYIDQSQSLNLLINPATPTKIVNSLIIEGWKLGIKTFYYQKNVNAAQKLGRDILNCSSCEA